MAALKPGVLRGNRAPNLAEALEPRPLTRAGLLDVRSAKAAEALHKAAEAPPPVMEAPPLIFR